MGNVSVEGQLQSFLHLTSQRATAIASNIANVDTPGYRTRDLDFSTEMSRALAHPECTPEHPRLEQVQGLLERPDGNNVDIDRESLALAETQLQYQAGTQLLKSRFHELLQAINGGGS